MTPTTSPTTLPSQPFATYEPSPAEPWDVRRAGHLLRRMTFGPTFASLDATIAEGFAKTIDAALEYDAAVDPLDDLQEQLAGYLRFDEMKQLQGWWVYRMLYTARPLQERLALVWHNLFATSANKVTSTAMMSRQLRLFEREGSANFRDLAVAIGKDPAMLVWLDGAENKKGSANENYAREVMELFTLGIGNYGEKDVKEVARAMTGWRLDGEKAVFSRDRFDAGEKTIFGHTGSFDAEAALDVILKQPAASRHLARRLLKEFVHPQPDDSHVDHYAARIVELNWQIKPILKELLSSRLFFSDWAYRSRIKSPIELCVGGAKMMGGKLNTQFIVTQATKMGQSILFPPNVKGWDGEEAWINANTVLLRFNYGMYLSTERGESFARKADLQAWLDEHHLSTAESIVDHYARVLLDGNLSDRNRDECLDYMKLGTKKDPKKFELTRETMNVKVRGIIHLLMAMPEYQLA